MRLYTYIGPKAIAERASIGAMGLHIRSANDVAVWMQKSGQEFDESGSVIATFVVDHESRLRIAHRRSEHVVCAGGKTFTRPVRSPLKWFLVEFAFLGSRINPPVTAQNQNRGPRFTPL